MQTSPLHVRRNQKSISAEKRNSAEALHAFSVSDHIDRQRRHVLELERESLSLESEIRALKKQMHDMDIAIQSKSGTTSSVESSCSDIEKITRSLILLSSTYMSGHELADKLVLQIVGALSSARPALHPDMPNVGSVVSPATKSLLRLDLPLFEDVICAAIVDMPGPGHALESYLRTYEKGVCEILGISVGAVRIFSSKNDEEEHDALRLLFRLSKEQADVFAIRIEEAVAASPDQLQKSVRVLVSSTRSVIIDAADSGGGSPSRRISNINSPASKPRESHGSLGEAAKIISAVGALITIPESTMDPSIPVPEAGEERPRSPSVKERITALEKSSGSSRVSEPAPGSLRMVARFHRQTASFFENSEDKKPPSVVQDSPGVVDDQPMRSGWGIKAPTPERRPSTSEHMAKKVFPPFNSETNATLVVGDMGELAEGISDTPKSDSSGSNL